MLGIKLSIYWKNKMLLFFSDLICSQFVYVERVLLILRNRVKIYSIAEIRLPTLLLERVRYVGRSEEKGREVAGSTQNTRSSLMCV